MKKTLILLFLIILLGASYLYVTKDKKETSSITIEDRDFVVEKAEDIHVITIKSKAYPLMHLSRKDDHWLVNRKYVADPFVLKNMLAALSKMKIKYIPPRAQNETIAKSIDNVGIDIKTYDKEGNILSDFIMASNTNDESGTYCIKRGAQQAYVMSMPILEGGLRNYFNHTLIDMRDKTIFSYDPKNITSIQVNYLKDKKNSFLLTLDNNKYMVSAVGQVNATPKPANKNIAYAYINSFDKLMAEVINQGNPELHKLQNIIPFAEIIITAKDKQRFQLELIPELDIFDRTINTRTVDDLAKIESYFVKTNTGEDYIVQHRLVAKCLKTIDYFTL